jgi:hypothetical protein
MFDDARVVKMDPAQWERGYGTIFFLAKVESWERVKEKL